MKIILKRNANLYLYIYCVLYSINNLQTVFPLILSVCYTWKVLQLVFLMRKMLKSKQWEFRSSYYNVYRKVRQINFINYLSFLCDAYNVIFSGLGIRSFALLHFALSLPRRSLLKERTVALFFIVLHSSLLKTTFVRIAH